MRTYILFILLIGSLPLHAQESAITFRWGISTFGMKEQRRLQSDFKTNNPTLPWKVVHSFPVYYNFGGNLSIKVSQKSSLGVWYEYNSTGGRLHYKDYSGFVYFDQVLRSSQIGAHWQHLLKGSQQWSLMFTNHVSVVFTKEVVDFAIQIGSDNETETLTLTSKHLGIRPGLLLQRKLGSFLFQSALGYEFQTRGQLTSDDDRYLIDNNGDKVTAQWDGLRLTLGVGILLQKP